MPTKLRLPFLRPFLAVPAAAAALALAPATAAADDTESFTGQCQLEGTVHADNSQDPVDLPPNDEQETIHARGVCTGTLLVDDRVVVLEASPVRLRAHGMGDQPFYVGRGSITFLQEAATIQFRFVQGALLGFQLFGEDGGTGQADGVPRPRRGNGADFEADLVAEQLSG